jgi:hypothetical protein
VINGAAIEARGRGKASTIFFFKGSSDERVTMRRNYVTA